MASKNAAIAAIEFALKTDEGLVFLRCWMDGDFPAIRKEWPDAPESVFVGADPLHQAAKEADNEILVAHVTVDDETMTVKPDEIHHALFSLGEPPRQGLEVSAQIRIDTMKESEFAALPEWQ